MQYIKKFFILTVLIFSITQTASAELPFYLDFKYILNESDAGKKAQVFLKKKLNNGIDSLNKREKLLQEEEKKLISKKKVISAEEYRKNVQNLRNKVSNLQKDRNKLLKDVADQRSIARNQLLKSLNPLIKKYMEQKKIRYVMDKKSLILADENLDITKDIIKLLNKNLQTIKLN